MSESLIISGFCKVKDNKVFLNDNLLFEDNDALTFADFSKDVYKFKSFAYPKFFKMDSLSKLGFMAAEILFGKYFSGRQLNSEETGIVLANSSSSLDTDHTYFDSIKYDSNYFPSPSVFVYTLPNIMIGEICIRHKITGESAFYVSEKFDAEFLHGNVKTLFDLNKVQQCLMGWVELMNDKYEAALYFVEKNNDIKAESVKFDIDNILKIYNKK